MLQNQAKNQYRIPLFCIVTMLYWFSMYTYVPILTPYVEQLGASHEMAGIIVGSYGFTQMLLRIPVGILSDKMHKRRLFISIGILFAFFSGVGLWLTKDVSWILLFRSLAGVAAATWVDFTILFTSYYKHEEATKAIGTISFYNSIAQMSAMFLGSWMADKISWSAPFALGAAVGLAGFAASFFLIDKYEDNGKKISVKELLVVIKDRTLITVSILAILSQVLTFATVFGFTPVFADHLGVSKFGMGLLTVFSSLPTAIASLVGGGYFSKRFGEKKVVFWGFVLTGVFTITIPFTTSFWLLIVTQALAGFGRGFSFPILMGLSIKDMPAEKRTTAMGFFQAIYGLGMFAGPVLMGVIGDILTLKQGFIVLGIIGCLTAVLAQMTIRSNGQSAGVSAGATG
ncbi:MFS transporter [Fodinisporobacter ferrooxydans]|uniref:MFS transporter n=1 Tax=Fodinisporobacter ferrooxydans TaxID=2901836 RepID=A0ABY4CKU5_9BACL|nr:MFS transporter [Alicyclobacillaceae bacterium MYW30-H2]